MDRFLNTQDSSMPTFEDLLASMSVDSQLLADVQQEMEDANREVDQENYHSALTNEELSRTYSL